MSSTSARSEVRAQRGFSYMIGASSLRWKLPFLFVGVMYYGWFAATGQTSLVLFADDMRRQLGSSLGPLVFASCLFFLAFAGLIPAAVEAWRRPSRKATVKAVAYGLIFSLTWVAGTVPVVYMATGFSILDHLPVADRLPAFMTFEGLTLGDVVTPYILVGAATFCWLYYLAHKGSNIMATREELSVQDLMTFIDGTDRFIKLLTVDAFFFANDQGLRFEAWVGNRRRRRKQMKAIARQARAAAAEMTQRTASTQPAAQSVPPAEARVSQPYTGIPGADTASTQAVPAMPRREPAEYVPSRPVSAEDILERAGHMIEAPAHA